MMKGRGGRWRCERKAGSGAEAQKIWRVIYQKHNVLSFCIQADGDLVPSSWSCMPGSVCEIFHAEY